MTGLIQTLSMGPSVSILMNWVRLYVGFEDTHSCKMGQNFQIFRYMADIILMQRCQEGLSTYRPCMPVISIVSNTAHDLYLSASSLVVHLCPNSYP